MTLRRPNQARIVDKGRRGPSPNSGLSANPPLLPNLVAAARLFFLYRISKRNGQEHKAPDLLRLHKIIKFMGSGKADLASICLACPQYV
jgi:hypothetical protein